MSEEQKNNLLDLIRRFWPVMTDQEKFLFVKELASQFKIGDKDPYLFIQIDGSRIPILLSQTPKVASTIPSQPETMTTISSNAHRVIREENFETFKDFPSIMTFFQNVHSKKIMPPLIKDTHEHNNQKINTFIYSSSLMEHKCFCIIIDPTPPEIKIRFPYYQKLILFPEMAKLLYFWEKNNGIDCEQNNLKIKNSILYLKDSRTPNLIPALWPLSQMHIDILKTASRE